MGALLALASAVFYGMADFAGGLLSRRAHFAAVALAGQGGGLILTAAVAPLVPASSPGTADLGWGALSGVGTGIGMVFLYRGLSQGAMSVVVPISAVTGVALPVLAEVLVLGDRPSALSWLGITVAVPALWLVAQEGSPDSTAPTPARDSSPASGRHAGAISHTAPLNGLVAGAGIALQYLALAQATPHAGVWPVAVGRIAAILTVLPLALSSRARLRLPRRQAVAAAVTGMSAACALVFYLLATHQQLVVIAVVLSSLYPAIPVLLGITVLRERLGPPQIAGLAAAAVAAAFLTAG